MRRELASRLAGLVSRCCRSHSQVRRLALDGPEGEQVEAELPGDGVPRSELAQSLVDRWVHRSALDEALLGTIRDRCLDVASEVESLATDLGFVLPPRAPLPGRQTSVRVVLEAAVDPRDLVEVARIYWELQALVPGAQMRFLGVGEGSLWLEVSVDGRSAQVLWERWQDGQLAALAGYEVRSLGAGSLPLEPGLPPLPRSLGIDQLGAWLHLALPRRSDTLADRFFDRALAPAVPVLAMHTGSPGDAHGRPALALLETLVEADPSFPYLPPDASGPLLDALLVVEETRVFLRGEHLAVEVPAREAERGRLDLLVDTATVEALQERCAAGLRLLLAPRHTPRFWIRLGGSVHLHQGFLVVPDRRSLVALIETEELVEAPLQILLGEPGMGKSTELRHLADRLWVCHPQDRVEVLDLRSVGSHDHLRELLGRALQRTGDGRIWLLLDSFDECLLRVGTLSEVLLEALAAHQPDTLGLRICCRTGAWPQSLGRQLAEWFGVETTPLELLPLRREDARKRAEVALGSQASTWLASVDHARLGALAARPVTLRLLLELSGEGPLPTTRTELYRLGIEHLAEEWSERRRDQPHDPRRLRQRLTAAGRIAAVMLLSGRSHVGSPAVPGALTLGELIGPEHDASGSWSMDEAVLCDVLDHTALFSSVGDKGRSFDHHSFAEYLAARHLVDHGFAGESALVLLRPGGFDQITPQLHGVAAWLAALDEQTRQVLVRDDPAVLLGSDEAALDHDLRAALVDSILRARAAGTAAEDSRTDDFRVLGHPGLQLQLELALERDPTLDRERDLIVRRTAVRIARDTGLRTLCPRLLELALDPDEQAPLRQAAAHAALDLDDKLEHVDAWLSLARGQAGPDPHHELRGAALQALWPRRRDLLSLREILSVPRSPGFTGSLDWFRDVRLPETLEDTDLPVILDLYCDQGPERSMGSHRDLWSKAFHRAWEVLDRDPSVLSALVDTTYRLQQDHRELPLEPGTIAASAARRRTFVEALVADARCADNTVWMLGWGPPSLLRKADLGWAVERYRDAQDDRARDNYRDAIRLCVDLEDPDHLDALYAACAAFPELGEWWRPVLWGPILLDSAEAERQRQWHVHGHRPEPPLLDPPPAERLSVRLEQCEADPRWWPRLLEVLALEPRSTHQPSPYLGDLRELPGWKAAEPATRLRILSCAQAYLTTTDPHPSEWFGTNKLPAKALAGLHAALLLQAEQPLALDGAGWWAAWACTFLDLSGAWKGAATEQLIQQARTEAPGALVRDLALRLERSRDDTNYQIALQHTERVWSEELAALVRAEVDRSDLAAGRRAAALSTRLVRGEGTGEELEALRADASLPIELRARAAVHRFRTHGANLPEDWWSDLARDEALAETVALELNDWRLQQGHSDTTAPARVLADLYRWLTARRPDDAGDRTTSGQVRWMSEHDFQEDLRIRLPGKLAHRAEAEDLAALQQLVADFPELRWDLDRARKNHLRRTWTPLEPREVVELLRRGPDQTT